MKKTTTKTKSPAPATSAAKTTKKKVAIAKSVPAVAAPAAPVAPVIPAVVPAAAPKAVAPAPVQTKIVARIDVGFGNTLFIRGDGPGLSWGQGVTMECVAGDQWEYTLGESSRPITFKLLLNDMTWCTGPDSIVASGSTVTVTPEFA